MSPFVDTPGSVLHCVARPWPNGYAPLVSELTRSPENKVEPLHNVYICTVSAGGIWDASGLLHSLRQADHNGIIAHAWDPAIAEVLADRLGDQLGGLLVQCGSTEPPLQADSKLIEHCQAGKAIRFVATNPQTVECLAGLGIKEPWVSLIPHVEPPRSEQPAARAEWRQRWRFAQEDYVISVLPSDIPGAMYAVAWAAFLVHEAVPNLRLLMAGASRDQRRSERMASGCGKDRIARFLAAGTPVEALIAAADLVVLPECSEGVEELVHQTQDFGVPLLSVAETLHPDVDTRPDTEHPYHDLAAEMLARIDAAPAQTPNDHAAQQAAWSQQVAQYRRLYAELFSTV